MAVGARVHEVNGTPVTRLLMYSAMGSTLLRFCFMPVTYQRRQVFNVTDYEQVRLGIAAIGVGLFYGGGLRETSGW